MTKIEENNGKIFVNNYDVEELIKLKEQSKIREHKINEGIFVIYQVLEALYQNYYNILPKEFNKSLNNFLVETSNIIEKDKH